MPYHFHAATSVATNPTSTCVVAGLMGVVALLVGHTSEFQVIFIWAANNQVPTRARLRRVRGEARESWHADLTTSTTALIHRSVVRQEQARFKIRTQVQDRSCSAHVGTHTDHCRRVTSFNRCIARRGTRNEASTGASNTSNRSIRSLEVTLGLRPYAWCH